MQNARHGGSDAACGCGVAAVSDTEAHLERATDATAEAVADLVEATRPPSVDAEEAIALETEDE
jgi:hypothetical protein